jgi:hypothetical protein
MDKTALKEKCKKIQDDCALQAQKLLEQQSNICKKIDIKSSIKKSLDVTVGMCAVAELLKIIGNFSKMPSFRGVTAFVFIISNAIKYSLNNGKDEVKYHRSMNLQKEFHSLLSDIRVYQVVQIDQDEGKKATSTVQNFNNRYIVLCGSVKDHFPEIMDKDTWI